MERLVKFIVDITNFMGGFYEAAFTHPKVGEWQARSFAEATVKKRNAMKETVSRMLEVYKNQAQHCRESIQADTIRLTTLDGQLRDIRRELALKENNPTLKRECERLNAEISNREADYSAVTTTKNYRSSLLIANMLRSSGMEAQCAQLDMCMSVEDPVLDSDEIMREFVDNMTEGLKSKNLYNDLSIYGAMGAAGVPLTSHGVDATMVQLGI
nr:hypothetical protein [Salmonid herpesvirus 1]